MEPIPGAASRLNSCTSLAGTGSLVAVSDAGRRGDSHDHHDREQAWMLVLERVFNEARHELLLPGQHPPWLEVPEVPPWRLRDRMKTVAAVLALCLNIGVDPPDVSRPLPCAKLECWHDPADAPQQKFVEVIANALQEQYEVWQSRARYRIAADPTAEDLKKICTTLRRAHGGREERILLHYNGHGVPRPSLNGELWVFNRAYTQYVPVLPLSLLQWIGSPCAIVLDCSNAGRVIDAFAALQASEEDDAVGGIALGEGVVVLAACDSEEQLPTNPCAADSQPPC